MSQEQIIAIKLRDVSQNRSSVPQIVRLRRLIKAAIRSFGFRCVSIEIVEKNDEGSNVE